MYTNQRPSDGVAIVTTIDAISQGAGAANSAWVSAANWSAFMAVIDVGVFGGSATVDFKVQQAQDNAGTGAKDITGKSITQLVAAGGNNRQAIINFRDTDTDANNGFGYVRMVATVGTAATQIAAMLYGFYGRFEKPVDSAANPSYNFGAATVAQIV